MSSDHLAVMIRAAKKAGVIQKKYFGRVAATRKRDGSFITKADLEAERAIIKILTPFGYDIIAEESGIKNNNSEYAFAIDPIDGTTNFAHGIPLFSVSIALLKDGNPIAGVVYAPMTEELWTAEKGKGAFKNGRRLRCENTDTGIIFFGVNVYDQHFPSRLKKFTSALLEKRSEWRQIESAAISITHVADGRGIASIGGGSYLWDWAAGAIIAAEAGLKVSDWQGFSLTPASKTFLAATPKAHRGLVALLR